MRSERVVIIGAGPAGASAAVQCLRLGVRPCLLDQTGMAGGLIRNAYRLENLVGVSPCDGQTFATSVRDHLTLLGLRIEEGTVERVTPTWGGFSVASSLGEISARSVILAVGTKPLPLSVPGIESLPDDSVFYEVRDLVDALPKLQDVIVVGGGEAALDYALSLAQVAKTVTVLVRGDKPKAARRLVHLVQESSHVRVLLDTTVTACHHEGSTIALELETRGGAQRMYAEALLVAVGRVSRVADLASADLVAGAYHELKPRPGLPFFLVGDARHGGLGQIAIAIGDGLLAATQAVEAVA